MQISLVIRSVKAGPELDFEDTCGAVFWLTQEIVGYNGVEYIYIYIYYTRGNIYIYI